MKKTNRLRQTSIATPLTPAITKIKTGMITEPNQSERSRPIRGAARNRDHKGLHNWRGSRTVPRSYALRWGEIKNQAATRGRNVVSMCAPADPRASWEANPNRVTIPSIKISPSNNTAWAEVKRDFSIKFNDTKLSLSSSLILTQTPKRDKGVIIHYSFYTITIALYSHQGYNHKVLLYRMV